MPAIDPNVKPGDMLKQKYAGVKEGGVMTSIIVAIGLPIDSQC